MKLTTDQSVSPAFADAFRQFAVARASDYSDFVHVWSARNRDSGWHALQCFVKRSDGVVDVAPIVHVRTCEASELALALETAREMVNAGKGVIGFD